MAKLTKAQQADKEESRQFLAELLNPRNARHEGSAAYPDQWLVDLPDKPRWPVDKYELRKHLPQLYFVIDSVARSGMSRKMRVYVMAEDEGKPYLRYITAHVARVLGWRLVRGSHDAIQVDGCGMDMTFHLTDCLAHAVFGYGPNALNANHFSRTVL